MIDRYSLSVSSANIKERFGVDVPEYYTPKYNAAPTHLLLVITSAAPNGLSLFYWGTSPEWSKNKVLAEKIINVRRENFEEKPSLKKALKKNRCLIPADGFYGWKKIGKRTAIPYRFILKNREAFSMAGLWEEFEDTDGNQIQTFTIITVPSNDLVIGIQERMPAIVSQDAEEIWLNQSSDEQALLNILVPCPSANMDYYPVSPGIADITKDVPSLIMPTPPADQHGNLTLFD